MRLLAKELSISTVAYAALTSKRQAAPSGASTTTAAPGMKTYLDVLAALVPAEVLAAHAAILTFTTKKDTVHGKSVTTITDPTSLKIAFWGLVAVCVVLYVVGHAAKWQAADFVRVTIPPLAFVGWCMAQRTTAFDAVSKWGVNQRSVAAILGALVLGALAAVLAYRADKQNPDSPVDEAS